MSRHDSNFLRSSAAFFATAAAVTAMLCAGSPARAGLYPPAAPPGSAFIRVFNGTTQRRMNARVGGKPIRDVTAYHASSYIFLAPGKYSADIGGTTRQVSLQGNQCYTAAVASAGMHLFHQPCFNSQIKALVSLYNLTGSKLSLRTADGDTTVIKPVGSDEIGQRAVNAVNVGFGVFSGGKKLANASPVTLQRGKCFSLFVVGSAAQPNLVWVVN